MNREDAREMEFVGKVDQLGLDGLFNTFRIGLKWADAEHLDQLLLTVIDGDERQTLDGTAVVLTVHHGTLGDMLDMHVGLNHGCSQTMPADRKAELRGILERAYGRPLPDSEKCTVLYLGRDPNP